MYMYMYILSYPYPIFHIRQQPLYPNSPILSLLAIHRTKTSVSKSIRRNNRFHCHCSSGAINIHIASHCSAFHFLKNNFILLLCI
ncbi:hypothetical protein I7I48_02341 [Histoplasma ohiense]|nr:hypothetical protein I7I48_02341 [Histoplasma ohiense (nom. inval.)]